MCSLTSCPWKPGPSTLLRNELCVYVCMAPVSPYCFFQRKILHGQSHDLKERWESKVFCFFHGKRRAPKMKNSCNMEERSNVWHSRKTWQTTTTVRLGDKLECLKVYRIVSAFSKMSLILFWMRRSKNFWLGKLIMSLYIFPLRMQRYLLFLKLLLQSCMSLQILAT